MSQFQDRRPAYVTNYLANSLVPWKPKIVSMALYGEARNYIRKETHFRTTELEYIKYTTKYMGYIDNACAVVDKAIGKLLTNL